MCAPEKRIQIWDSMLPSTRVESVEREVGVNILKYVVHECYDKKKVTENPRDWSVAVVQGPQQENGDDCGVFMLTVAEELSKGHTPQCVQVRRYKYEIAASPAEFSRQDIMYVYWCVGRRTCQQGDWKSVGRYSCRVERALMRIED